MGLRLAARLRSQNWKLSSTSIFIGVGLGAMHKTGYSGRSSAGSRRSAAIHRRLQDGKTTQRRGQRGRNRCGQHGHRCGQCGEAAGSERGFDPVSAHQGRISRRSTLNIKQALQEGVRFLWLTQLMAIHASADGIASVECVRMEIDSDGSLKPIEGSAFHIECNMVIPAIGQSPMLELLAQCRDVQLERGRVVVDRATGQTTNPQVLCRRRLCQRRTRGGGCSCRRQARRSGHRSSAGGCVCLSTASSRISL